MAELIFADADLGNSNSTLRTIYNYLSEELGQLASAEAPETGDAPEVELDEDGNVTNEDELTEYEEEVQAEIEEYSTVAQKNAAYVFAYAITLGASGSSSTSSTVTDVVGYLALSGGSMTGALYALNGFYAGADDEEMLTVTEDGVTITEGTAFNVSEITFGDGATISWSASKDEETEDEDEEEDNEDAEEDDDEEGDDEDGNDNEEEEEETKSGVLTITSGTIELDGDVDISGTLSVGGLTIDENGISLGDYEFYHSGNCNNADTDWTMKDAYVYGDLVVEGDSTMSGFLSALYGFELGAGGTKLIYSIEADEEAGTAAYISISSDLNIEEGYSIKMGEKTVLFIEDGEVNIAAPGTILKLGATADEEETEHISLKTSIYNYSDIYELITKEGAGYFPNSLQAKYATGGELVLSTYSGEDDHGVLFQHYIRFGSTSGPALYAGDEDEDEDADENELYVQLPYKYYENGVRHIEDVKSKMYYDETVSAVDGADASHDMSLNIEADANFITFRTPVQSEFYSIYSDTSMTILKDSVLYLEENLFIEGVKGESTNHFLVNGDTYFTGDIRSTGFSSGFAGYGWAVIDESGSYSATFDNLTVRKKFRTYELEVQKISATNGSLWVSDSCSGDSVEEVA